jgi:hypothetical protein
MVNIIDVAGEDGQFVYPSGNPTIGTGGNFRAGFARCAFGVSGSQSIRRMWGQTLNAGWTTARVDCPGHSEGYYGGNNMFSLVDANGVTRIALVTPNGNITGPYNVVKFTAAGVATTLGQTNGINFSTAPAIPDKLDVQWNYSSGGLLNIYINAALAFSYAGDITTDDGAAISGVDYMSYCNAGDSNTVTWYSELITADGDTRTMNLVTLAATGPGTVDQMTGAYTNASQISVNDANYDTTTTAGAVQRYKMSDLPAGTYNVLTKATQLRGTLGSGLGHIAVSELIGGAAFTQAAVPLPAGYADLPLIFENTNPATGVAWTMADINDAAREAGYQVSA